MRKIVAVADPYWAGHHPTYVKQVSRALLELGHEVRAFCPEPDEVRAWIETTVPGQRADFEAHPFLPPAASTFPLRRFRATLSAIAHWRAAARAIAAAGPKRPDLVFFPWLDSHVFSSGVPIARSLVPHAADRLFPFRWAGIYFHPRHLRVPSGDASGNDLRLDAMFRASRCKGVAVLDEGIADALRERIPGTCVVVLPDIADPAAPDPDYALAREVRRRAAGRTVVGLLGSLERRKGLTTLLDVARIADPARWFFAIAGELAANTFAAAEMAVLRSVRDDPPPNVLIEIGRIPDEAKFNALVQACDVLFAAYFDFPHSSNLLAKAVLFGRRIIVSKGFLMEERAASFGLGPAVHPGNVASCLAALRELGSASAPFPAPDFAGYQRRHSHERLVEGVDQLMRSLEEP